MNNLSRKDFIRLSSWGLLATLLPVGKLEAFSISNTSKTPNEDYEKAKLLAKQAKVLCYNKKHKEAEELYLQCIALAPASIRFYDNLDNVYGATRQPIKSVLLYQKGLNSNLTKVAFFDRAARSLMRLELGAKKIAEKYKVEINSQSLLADAKILYSRAIDLAPSKNYLKIGLEKIDYKISSNAATDKEYRKSKENKIRRKEHKAKFNDGFKAKTNEQILKLIDKVDTKKRVTLFDKKEIEQQKKFIIHQKKKYYRLLLSRKNTDAETTFAYTEKTFNLDPSDSISLKSLKSIYYKNNKQFEFIEARQKFDEIKQTVYSRIGLMDAMEVAYLKEKAPAEYLNRAVEIGYDLLKNWSLVEKTQADVAIKMSKILCIQSKHAEAIGILDKVIANTTTKSPIIVNSLISSYANVHFKFQKLENAKNILLIATDPEKKEAITGFSNIKTLMAGIEKDNFNTKLSQYYLLYNTYTALNQMEDAKQILELLSKYNPQDKFVLTRNL